MATFLLAVSISTLTFASLLEQAQAGAFLQQNTQVQLMPAQEVEFALLSELSTANNSIEILKVMDELRPVYAAVPKNENGRLESSVVRYTMHRYFTHKYGWHVTGLDPVGGSYNNSSPVNIMKDKVPAFIQGLMEQRLEGHGMGLTELAIFALTLKDLIYKETIVDFEDVWAAHGASPSDRLDIDTVRPIIKAYLTVYIKGIHAQGNNPEHYVTMQAEMSESLFTWPDALVWLEDIMQTHILSSRRNPFVRTLSFNDAAEIAQEVGNRFFSFQNLECSSIKQQLVNMEDAGTGRVRLSRFYLGIHDSEWPFIESPAYLRNLGVMDDTDLKTPTVIIPNYMYSRTNCVAPSSFYSVCCLDECEGLVAQVERAIGEPLATPGQLMEVVSRLESDTVAAPRNLTTVQLTRLSEIAALHSGRVPLHGRMFAQWMHYAFPRECPFPRPTGTTNPLFQHQYELEVGTDTDVSDAEAMHAKGLADREASEVALPWTTAEELIASHKEAAVQPTTSTARIIVFLFAIASASAPAVRAASKQSWPGTPSSTVEKHMV